MTLGIIIGAAACLAVLGLIAFAIDRRAKRELREPTELGEWET